MSVAIYIKKINEPDSAYTLVTDTDDNYEVVTNLEPGTTYRFKKVEAGQSDLFQDVTTQAASPEGTITSIRDYLEEGTNITFSGAGTKADKLVINATGTTTGSDIPFFNPATLYQFGTEPTLVKWATEGILRIWTLKDTPTTNPHPENYTLNPKVTRAAPSYLANSQWYDVGLDVAEPTTGSFNGFETEDITAAGFPYTTLKKTTYKNIQGLYWGGIYQPKPSADNATAPIYTITINANGSATIDTIDEVDPGTSGQLVYVATGNITNGGGGGTPQDPAPAAPAIALNDATNDVEITMLPNFISLDDYEYRIVTT